MYEGDELNEMFRRVRITPDVNVKRHVKNRMLLAAEENSAKTATETNLKTLIIVRRIIMEIKRKFKITKQHWQGAIAMLLVVALVFSALIITPATKGALFGTMFKGYEDAQEKTIQINPGEVEAVSGFEQTLTLAGLPEDELTNIKAEHIFLGGYFADKAVLGVEVTEAAEGGEETEGQTAGLRVTVGGKATPPEDGEESAVDWEGADASEIGVIAITPEAFKDKSYFYQGSIDVIQPTLDTETEAIAYDADGNVSQEITMNLRNDIFSKTLTADDLNLKGDLKEYTITNLTQTENAVSFVLSGKVNETAGYVEFAIGGDFTEKGFQHGLSIRIGSVPMPYQASALYVMNDDIQTLDIFMDNDTYAEDVKLSMLSFTGVMKEFTATGLKRLDSKNIRLTLSGRAQAGTGSVVFDSNAVGSGRSGRTAEITVVQPELFVEEPLVLEDGIVITFGMANVADMKDKVTFTFGGVLEGYSADDITWAGSNCGVITVAGTAKKGKATLTVDGLYQTSCKFSVGSPMALEPVEDEEAENNEETDAGAIGRSGNSLVNLTHTTQEYEISNLLSNNGKYKIIQTGELFDKAIDWAIDALKDLAIEGLKAGAKQGFMWGFMQALQMFGFGGDDTMALLKEINTKLDALSMDMKAMENRLIGEMKQSQYETQLGLIKSNIDIVDAFYKDLIDCEDYMSQKSKDAAYEKLLDINKNASGIGTVRTAMNNVLKHLDPYGSYADISLTKKYHELALSKTPFAHNTADLMKCFTNKWACEMGKYMVIHEAICAYNIEKYPTSKNTDMIADNRNHKYYNYNTEFIDYVKNVSKNISNYMPAYYRNVGEALKVSNGYIAVKSNLNGKIFSFTDPKYLGYENRYSEGFTKCSSWSYWIRQGGSKYVSTPYYSYNLYFYLSGDYNLKKNDIKAQSFIELKNTFNKASSVNDFMKTYLTGYTDWFSFDGKKPAFIFCDYNYTSYLWWAHEVRDCYFIAANAGSPSVLQENSWYVYDDLWWKIKDSEKPNYQFLIMNCD